MKIEYKRPLQNRIEAIPAQKTAAHVQSVQS